MRPLILLMFFLALVTQARAGESRVLVKPELPVSIQNQPVQLILTPRLSRTFAVRPELPPELVSRAPEPLFSRDEQANLAAIGADDLALAMKVIVHNPSAAEELKAWCKKHLPNWVVEQNSKVEIHQASEDQFQRYQWGLSNVGRSQGFTLDTHRVGELPAEPGQDIGVLRARPEVDFPADRPKTIVAVLDTGLDYDRDSSGRITGGHPDFAGQVIDKTGKGEECDPGSTANPEQMLEGTRGRRARYKQCVASGATDCLTRLAPDGRPDFDRDRNGYPIDCLGWNVTTALTRATDLLGDDDTRDKLGHGTHVAGIIAAAADGEGTRGVVTKNISILPVKVVDRAPNAPIIPQDVDCRRLGAADTHDLFSDGTGGSCTQQTMRDLVRALISIPGPRVSIRTREELIQAQSMRGPFLPPPPPGSEEEPLPQERMLNPGNTTLGFTDQIARGILYAIRSKANVISMSLAWPSDADSELMKRLTKLARDRGILVVASAGNDSAEARTMPCQYSSVICVASHDPSGALSYFSNYGAAVDVAAPGASILSTWPRALKTGRRWTSGPAGYEQKSGTSMAAPMVAGVLARLLNSGFTPDEAQARLYAGVRPLPPRAVCDGPGSGLCADPANLRPLVRTGNVDLARSEQAQPEPIIMPDPKGPVTVMWSPTSEVAPFEISLKNYWTTARMPRVEFTLRTDEEPTLAGAKIELLTPASFNEWAPLDSKTIQAQLRFAGSLQTRLKMNGRFFVNVRVIAENATPRSFDIPFELVALIDSTHPFPGALELAIEGNPELKGDLLTVVPRDGQPDIEYVALDADADGFTMRILRELPAQPPLLTRFAVAGQIRRDKITNAIRLADIQRIDHEIGKPSGYVLIFETAPAEGNISGLRFDFFDHDLKFVKTLRYDNVVSGIDGDHWTWLKMGNSKVPAWVGFGLLPKEEYPDPDFYPAFYVGQSDPDDERAMRALREANNVSHTREQGRRILFDSMRAFGQDHFQRNRFYFLEPQERKERDPETGAEAGEIKAIARTGGINPKVPDRRYLRTRAAVQAPPADFSSYVPLAMLVQTAEERRAGSVRLLLATPEKNSAGREINSLRYAIGRVKELRTVDEKGDRPWIIEDLVELLQPEETKNLVGLPDVLTMIPLGLSNQADPRATFMGQPLELGRYEANLLVASSRAAGVEVRTRTINPPAPTDSVFHAAGVFQGNGRLAMFGETHYDLQYNDLVTQERAAISLGRFSFMPQAAVSKSLMPVVIRNERGGDFHPGILIPAQLRSSANLEVIIPSYNSSTGKLERLITPAKLRLQAGQGCRALKIPTQATEAAGPSLMFLCDGRFIQVPMSY